MSAFDRIIGFDSIKNDLLGIIDIIKNPDIKMIAVNGVAPNKDNIRDNSYPIVAPVYAVTYEGNSNENVHKLTDWILSEEGQYIIEETGYVGLGKK